MIQEVNTQLRARLVLLEDKDGKQIKRNKSLPPIKQEASPDSIHSVAMELYNLQQKQLHSVKKTVETELVEGA